MLGHGGVHFVRRWWCPRRLVIGFPWSSQPALSWGFPHVHEWCWSSKDGGDGNATSAGLCLLWLGFFEGVQAATAMVVILPPCALLFVASGGGGDGAVPVVVAVGLSLSCSCHHPGPRHPV